MSENMAQVVKNIKSEVDFIVAVWGTDAICHLQGLERIIDAYSTVNNLDGAASLALKCYAYGYFSGVIDTL